MHCQKALPSSKQLQGEMLNFLKNSAYKIFKQLPETAWMHPCPVQQIALSIACTYGFTILVRIYLEMGVSPDGDNCHQCEPPIRLAAIGGHSEIVALLLEYGASISSRKWLDGATALHYAAAYGSPQSVLSLLDHGASVNASTADAGLTPLHFAIQSANTRSVKLLIDYGADLNAVSKCTMETPLHLAAVGGQFEASAQLLRGRGAQKIMIELYDSIVKRAYYQSWSEEMMNNGSNSGGNWPYIWEYDSRCSAEIDMQLLLDCSNSFAHVNKQDCNGLTPLHQAALRGREPITRLLIENGANTTLKDKDGCTALQMAVQNGHLGVIRILLTCGAGDAASFKTRGADLENAVNKGHDRAANLMLWQSFSTEVAGKANQWPILSLAMKSQQNTAREALNKKRGRHWRSEKTSRKRLPLREL